jgi:ABC-type nitrate/sulfonate/bicarbonate transport system substrate-binding protein
MRTRSFLARRFFGVTVLGTSILVTGCSSGTGSAALTSVAAPEKPDITVAAIPAVDLAGLYIAQDRGLFARPGQLAGRKIGVNGVNSIGTLLVAALLSAHGISPAQVRFVTDPDGFPAMPGALEHGAWSAAFLAEPYITAAGQQYGQLVLADLDHGAVLNLPVDGYVATQACSAVQATMARHDQLPPEVTGSMAMPSSYPVGPVVAADIQRVAAAMLKFGVLSSRYGAAVGQGTLVRSMVSPG